MPENVKRFRKPFAKGGAPADRRKNRLGFRQPNPSAQLLVVGLWPKGLRPAAMVQRELPDIDPPTDEMQVRPHERHLGG